MQHLIAFCLNDACRHQALTDVSSYPAETEVPWFKNRVKCNKCGGRAATRSTCARTGKRHLAHRTTGPGGRLCRVVSECPAGATTI